jgi:hypothetical protein
MERTNEELLKDKATTESDIQREPEEIKPEDADRVVGGFIVRE